MGIHSISTHVDAGPSAVESVAELDRLGDEIAELAAHLTAATARLLDLIREFDARDGWANGFRSCAAWLIWRVGFSPIAGLGLHAHTATPGWLGEPLDVGYAMDVLHLLAR
jgi:hypothetical protein